MQPQMPLTRYPCETRQSATASLPAAPSFDQGVWHWLTSKEHSSLLHPLSGLWILGLDWMLFGGNVVSLGLLTILMMLAGFVIGGAGTAFIQGHYTGNGVGACFGKGLLGGLVVGVPFPVAGTFAGTIILAVSGLKALRNKMPFRS